MKNRYLPFGYKIADGKIVTDSEQVEAVRRIFDAYTAGQTFQQIADVLSAQGIPYRSDASRWNKNMVSRILANADYCGTAEYPQIITVEQLEAAEQIRKSKTVTYSVTLKPFRKDMQCGCCGARLYWHSHHAEVNENHKTGGRRKAPGFMRKQQRFSLHCLPGCGTIAVLRQGSTTMKTTAMTAEERVRYMTQAPVRRLILEMSAPTVILCTMLLQTIGMAWQASVVAAARQGLFLIPVVFILPNLLGLAGVEYAQPAADLLAFALALPMGLSVLKTFRSDAPTPAHTLREE